MTAFNFFDGRELVRPAVTVDDAELMARELFGISGTATELGSQQDRNFRIDTETPLGTSKYLLKVDNTAFSEAELAVQDDAMRHLAARGLCVPVPIDGRDGASRQRWTANGEPIAVRMLSFLEGSTLAPQQHLGAAVIGRMGELAAQVVNGLCDFRSDGLDRQLQWDMRNASRVVELLVEHVPDEGRRSLLERFSTEATERLTAVADGLRVQPIHGDVTDDNVICSLRSDGTLWPDGVIDFGDLGNGWLVAELAVTISSLVHHRPMEPLEALEAVAAFDRIVPLSDAEIAAVWPLVVLRGAVLVVSGEHQLVIDESNEYAEERTGLEWQVFESASALGWDEAEAAIRALLGRPAKQNPPALGAAAASAAAATAPLIDVPAEQIAYLDFTVTSPALAEGRWLSEDVERELAAAALAHATVAVAPYGQYRLTRTPTLSASAPQTGALHTELFAHPGLAVHAPLDGVISRCGDHEVRLETAQGVLAFGGLSCSLTDGETIAAGSVVGFAQLTSAPGGQLSTRGRHVSAREIARVTVQLLLDASTEAPLFVTEQEFAAWVLLAPDPAKMLGLQSYESPFSAERETERRERIFAGAQERYYENPPQIERGWREFLIDTTGRSYLDMVNNVSGIGHSHPRLTRAVTEQMQLLNTNSRFLYSALAELSERLVELAPDPSLDTVMLVNSGSEATDLAIRLAQIHTGRRTIVALREAYHGWSMASDAVSTSAFDNPNALLDRPGWVEVADIPNVYRGTHQGDDAGARYLADLIEQLDALPEDSIAAFMSEPVIGNAGGIAPPPGYLAGAYEEIRRRGGVCIADEVQVGYGRLGTHFWGSEHQGVVPDIIAVAKAMGNAYPLGAVITRRDIAESLAREGNFFSSAGGAPVSCVAGLEVLNVMRDEKLQENAVEVGAHLRAGVEALMERHPLIGAVHGSGLYQGIELVRDRETKEPAVEETAAICERLRELGIIMQATSERQNVLKVKPPLCLAKESADFFVQALDEVLSMGWSR